MPIYRTVTITGSREVFFGYTGDARRTRAFTAPQNFERIVAANVPGEDGRAAVQRYATANWARRLARALFSGARLRAALRRV